MPLELSACLLRVGESALLGLLRASRLLERLGYRHGTDKSRDDHAYVGTYAMLFDPIRLSVVNMTEVLQRLELDDRPRDAVVRLDDLFALLGRSVC